MLLSASPHSGHATRCVVGAHPRRFQLEKTPGSYVLLVPNRLTPESCTYFGLWGQRCSDKPKQPRLPEAGILKKASDARMGHRWTPRTLPVLVCAAVTRPGTSSQFLVSATPPPHALQACSSSRGQVNWPDAHPAAICELGPGTHYSSVPGGSRGNDLASKKPRPQLSNVPSPEQEFKPLSGLRIAMVAMDSNHEVLKSFLLAFAKDLQASGSTAPSQSPESCRLPPPHSVPGRRWTSCARWGLSFSRRPSLRAKTLCAFRAASYRKESWGCVRENWGLRLEPSTFRGASQPSRPSWSLRI